MKSFSYLLTILSLASSLCQAEEAKRPNVVIVIADQWRAQAFGYAGDPNAKTPHFDAFEKQSIRFVNAVSNVPVCTPMRATFLTGQRPLTHGLFMNDAPLNPALNTIAKSMDQAGYDTGFIGKWHVDGHGRSSFIPKERRQGFEYWKVLECTHAYNNSFYYADGPEKLKWDGYDALAQTRDADQYVKDHSKTGKPFMLVLSWGPPHDPYLAAPGEYQAMFDPAKLVLPPNVPAAMAEKTRKNMVGYYAHGAALDNCFRMLLNSLAVAGLEGNTIVLFTSDHGDMMGSQGATHKQRPYEESVRVPLMIRYPARFGPEGKRLATIINTQDIMPTVLGMCDVPIPDSVQGISLAGFLAGGKDPSDDAALISCPVPFAQFNRLVGGREYRGIRTARYTYVRDLKGPWLLFDNQVDPYQMDNLVNKPEQAALQTKLDAKLQRMLKEQGDEFLPASAYIEKWGYKVDKNGTIPYTN